MSYLLECYFKNYTNIKRSLKLENRYWLTRDQVMNELYIKLVNRKRMDSEYIADPQALLKVITRHLILDLVKHDSFYSRRVEASGLKNRNRTVDPTTFFEQEYFDNECRDFISKNASKLGPSRCRIVNRIMNKESLDSIAKDLNIKKESVRVQLFTATKELQEMWRKHEIKIDSKQQAEFKKKGDELLLLQSS